MLYIYHINKEFAKFYHRHSEMSIRSNVCLKTLLQQAYQINNFMVITTRTIRIKCVICGNLRMVRINELF